MAKVVNIGEVELSGDAIDSPLTSDWHIRKQKEVLVKQGLIEPICVVQDVSAPYKISAANWYDDYNLLAAKELGWKTVIIAVCDRSKEH